MGRKNNTAVPSFMLKAAFRRWLYLVAIIASLLVAAATPVTQAQTRYNASPTNWFLSTTGVQDKLFPDYVVEFEIPIKATNIFVYTTTAGIESRVLAFSTIYPSYTTRNGKKVVRVVAGYRARKCSSSYNPLAWTCNYTGSVAQWANSLRVRYYM